MIDTAATDRRSRMISALVEDMIRMMTSFPPPLPNPNNTPWLYSNDRMECIEGYAVDLAALANAIYDAAEAAVDIELVMDQSVERTVS